MRKPSVAGRGWAYVGALLGGVVSVAANVAHSYVPPADAPDHWSPQGGAVVGAIFWPVALFVAVEILARVPWPTGRKWWWLRFGGLLPVAAVAALVSYRHLAGLLRFYGEDGITATLGPLAVDGLMVVATGALLVTARHTAAVVDTALAVVAAPVDVAVTAPEPPPEPATDATPAIKPAPAKRVTRKPASAEKVARASAKMPGATVAEIAAKAGVSESTARRYLPPSAATVASATAPDAAETLALIAA
jgi:hypothetical protein